jgi:uncharacterized membrane protein YqiK
VIVPENKVGLVTKKFVLFGANKELSGDRIIAVNGEAGFQAKMLETGLHWFMWPWQYSVDMQSFIVIPEGHIGLISAKDGKVPQTGRILGRKVECEDYQDAEAFIKNGGQKGRQAAFITNGSYKINTLLFEVSTVKQAQIQENMVGVVTTLDGEPLEAGQISGKSVDGHNNFQDFNTFLDKGGNRGLQQQVILAGSYNLNPWAVAGSPSAWPASSTEPANTLTTPEGVIFITASQPWGTTNKFPLLSAAIADGDTTPTMPLEQ